MRSLYGQLLFAPVIFFAGFLPLVIGFPYDIPSAVQTVGSQRLPRISDIEVSQQPEQFPDLGGADGGVVFTSGDHGMMCGFGPTWIITL